MPFIDTHSHIYGEEFAADLDAVVQRAKNAGAEKLFLPNENAGTLDAVLDVCDKYPGFCFPMIGLHPEEIKENYSGVLDNMERRLQVPNPFIAVGEVGIDYHFQSENKAEQICAFRRQTEWAGKYSLPLMIHSRDSIDDLLAVLEDCGGKGFGCVSLFFGHGGRGSQISFISRVCFGNRRNRNVQAFHACRSTQKLCAC